MIIRPECLTTKFGPEIPYPHQTLYTDAGLITKSYTEVGGMWAYILVDEKDEVIKQDCGLLLTPYQEIKRFESNFLETYAILQGFKILPDDWWGMVCCDNLNALKRFFLEIMSWNAVPESVRFNCHEQIRRLQGNYIQGVLLGGHPIKEEIEADIRRDGKPISKWNILCDTMCNELKEEYLKNVK